MFRPLFLIFFLCGLIVLSVCLAYRASAEADRCSVPIGVCLPEVKLPVCERPDCEVERPLLRSSCAPAWRKPLIADAIRCPQRLCFVFEDDKLQTVARVSTLDILRAMGR